MAELPVVPQRQRFENPLPRDGQERQERAWFPVKWEEGRAGASAVGCGGQECVEESEEPLDRPAGKGVRWHGGDGEQGRKGWTRCVWRPDEGRRIEGRWDSGVAGRHAIHFAC